MSDNYIVSVPSFFGNLTGLTKLDMSKNQLTALPGEMQKLQVRNASLHFRVVFLTCQLQKLQVRNAKYIFVSYSLPTNLWVLQVCSESSRFCFISHASPFLGTPGFPGIVLLECSILLASQYTENPRFYAISHVVESLSFKRFGSHVSRPHALELSHSIVLYLFVTL